jgi:hypothetical protein
MYGRHKQWRNKIKRVGHVPDAIVRTLIQKIEEQIHLYSHISAGGREVTGGTVCLEVD